MTLTKTLMMSAAAAAFMLGASSSGTLAQECTEPLPNKNWGGYDLSTSVSDIAFNPAGNGHVEVSTRCNAINPGGNIDPDHSYDLGEPETVLVCHKDKGLTDAGAALGLECPS